MSSNPSNITAPQPLPSVLNLSTTIGPILIGTCVGLILFGILLIQVVWYYIHYPKDHILLKIWIAILVCVGSLHELFSFLGVYLDLIPRFGDIALTLKVQPYLLGQTLMTSIAEFMVQFFFLYRIFLFAEHSFVKYGIPLLLSPLIVWELVGGSIYVYKGLRLKSALELSTLEEIEFAINGSQCAVDIVIALTMSMLLYTRKTGITVPDRMIQNLMIASINTGAWTALLAIAVVVLINVTPASDFIYSAPYFVLTPVYINTVLSNLNIRNYLLTRTDVSEDTYESGMILDTLRHPARRLESMGTVSFLNIERKTSAIGTSSYNRKPAPL